MSARGVVSGGTGLDVASTAMLDGEPGTARRLWLTSVPSRLARPIEFAPVQ